jgi:hypothetical protein
LVAVGAACGAGLLCAKAGNAIKAKASTIDRKMIFCDTRAPLKYLRDGNTKEGVGRRDASCRVTLFAVIVCRKFASGAAFSWHFPSWHFRSEFLHHKNAAAMNRKVRDQDIAKYGSRRCHPCDLKLRSFPHISGCKALYLLMFFGNYAPGSRAMPLLA